ncbi:MAG: alpha-amylase family protein [Spirochaetota bacterium]
MKAQLKDIQNEFVFGTQYYRVVPPKTEWADDMKHISELGMDTIKIWALWTYGEPREGKFNFSDLDGLMDEAQRKNLRVVINIILDHCPLWAVQKFPESQWTDLNGRRMTEHAYAQRFLGGVGLCWDNTALRKTAEPFIRALAKRYKDHPSLYVWDAWNEPDKLASGDVHTAARFREYLAKRFGTIEKLNEHLVECYADLSEVFPPDCKSDVAAQLLYNDFRQRSLGDQVRWVYDTIRSEDTHTPIMTHSHSGTTQIGWGADIPWDDWRMADAVDFYGTSSHEIWFNDNYKRAETFATFALSLETKRSIAAQAKKIFWLDELSGGLSYMLPNVKTSYDGRRTTFNLWTALAYEAKGILFWQFRPERKLGSEAPGWGLVERDGEDTDRSRAAAEFIGTVRAENDLFLNARCVPARYGIVYDMDSHLAANCTQIAPYNNGFQAVFSAFYTNSVPCDILRYPGSITEQYEMIYVPEPWCVSAALKKALFEYAERGGRLIIECGLGLYDENGFTAAKVPNQGWDATIGLLERNIRIFTTDTIQTDHGGIAVGKQRVDLRMTDAWRTTASFSDGTPAAVTRAWGKGSMTAFASLPSAGMHALRESDPKCVPNFIRFIGAEPCVDITSGGNGITCRVMECGGKRLLFVFNHCAQNASVSIDCSRAGTFDRLLWNNCVSATGKGHRIDLHCSVESIAVIVLSA